MIERVAEKEQRQGRDVTHINTSFHSMSDPVSTPRDHTYRPHALITPTSHNFKTYISFTVFNFGAERNVRFKIVASGCDQCVLPVGVVPVCGHWVRH